MKLSTIAIATLVAGLAEAKKPSGIDAKMIQKGMANVDTKTLLRRARKLEGEDGEDEEEEFEITSDYTIQFNSCASLNVLDVDAVDTYVQNAQNSGQGWNLNNLQMYKDYVVFDATSSSSGSTIQYVIDLPTFVSTLVEAVPTELGEYCNACSEAYDSCYPQGDDQANNEGNRKLESGVEYVDCDTCVSNGCFTNAQNNGDGGDGGDGGDDGESAMYTDAYGATSSDAVEWFNEVAECQAISQDSGYYNYYYTHYAGLTCNAAGTGVEIAVYSDEDCTVPTSTSFYSIMQNEGRVASYVDMTKTLVEKAFTRSFSCQSVEYASPYDDEDGDEDGGDADEDEEANYEANEICRELTEGETAFDLSQSCDQDGDGNNYQYDEDGNAWGSYTYGNYGTISYDINDAEDVEQVCTAMQSKGGSYSTKGPSAKIYSYNGKTSQNTYTWGLADSSSNNSQTSAPTTTSDSSNGGGGDGFDWEGTKQQVGDTYSNVSGKVSETYGNVSEKVGNGISRASEKSGLAIEEVVGIVLGALAGLCLFLTCACYCCCKRTDEDPKQVHLIGRERKEWQAKDKWNTTQNRDTWA